MTEKAFYDIEALHPWQKDLITGFRYGEHTIMMSGRQTGKSAFARLWQDVMNAQRPVEDLRLDEGTVFGARYHTVEPIGGNWHDMAEWCIASFGPPAEIWEAHNYMWPECGRWYQNDRKFWFRNEKDRTMFILRWRS